MACPMLPLGFCGGRMGQRFCAKRMAGSLTLNLCSPLTNQIIRENILCSVIADMNPMWDEKDYGQEEAFEEAARLAKVILERKFISIRAQRAAFSQVEELVKTTKGNVLEMERAMPWKKAVCGSGIEFVIFPSSCGGYMVQAVPVEEHSQVLKHPFPKQWGERHLHNCRN